MAPDPVLAVVAWVMTNDGKRTIALRASAGLFVLTVARGVAVAAQPIAATPDTLAAIASIRNEMPFTPEDPGGLTSGGALPVVPGQACPTAGSWWLH